MSNLQILHPEPAPAGRRRLACGIAATLIVAGAHACSRPSTDDELVAARVEAARARDYQQRIAELKEENATLRQELERWRQGAGKRAAGETSPSSRTSSSSHPPARRVQAETASALSPVEVEAVKEQETGGSSFK